MRIKWVLLLFVVLALCPLVGWAQNDGQTVLSDQNILSLAGDKYALGELPLGDYRYTLDGPRKGYVYLCRKYGDGRGGAQHAGNWIHGTTWNAKEKPAVQGNVTWSDASFSIKLSGDERILEGNGLPIDHGTGIFPIQANDPASLYDRNPNSIRMQTIEEAFPANPAYSDPPFCMGMEVGYMLDGVPLFNGFDAGLRDAAAHEVQDACDGHPQSAGTYHYHSLSSCIQDASEKTVIGYALDGFPITGPYVGGGKYLTTEDLDECHGLTSEIIQDGQKKITYHYVMTLDFPYSASCFRAKPVRTGPPQQEMQQRRQGGLQNGAQGFPSQGNLGGMQGMQGQAMPSMNGMNGAMGEMNGNRPHPPPEALNACAGRNDGDTCGFVSPRGDNITGTCHAPPQSGLACIPAQRP